MKFRCKVIRQQAWDIEVEAEDREEAKDKADAEALTMPPHDDYAYETLAVEIDR